MNTLLKIGIAGLAGLTSLGATLVIVFILILPEGAAWWIGGRLVVAGFVVAMGVLTVQYLRAATPLLKQVLLLGAIGLTALGAAGAVWGFHLAEVTGDLEAWAIMICALMSAQGAATIWHLWRTNTSLRPAVG